MSRSNRSHGGETRSALQRRSGRVRGLLVYVRLMLWSALARVRFGRMRYHLLLSVASLLNGSTHCGYVQSYAFQLAFFGRRRALFPVDESELLALTRESDLNLRERLDQALAVVGLEHDAELLHRLYALKLDGEPPRSFTDLCIARLVELMDVATCSCTAGAWPLEDGGHGEGALARAYTQARLERPAASPKAS